MIGLLNRALPQFAMLALVVVCATSCATLTSANYLSDEEFGIVQTRAREREISSGLLHDEREKQLVSTAPPNISYYFMAKPYAQYSIEWDIAADESIVIAGQGNILELEGSTIQRAGRAPARNGRPESEPAMSTIERSYPNFLDVIVDIALAGFFR